MRADVIFSANIIAPFQGAEKMHHIPGVALRLPPGYYIASLRDALNSAKHICGQMKLMSLVLQNLLAHMCFMVLGLGLQFNRVAVVYLSLGLPRNEATPGKGFLIK